MIELSQHGNLQSLANSVAQWADARPAIGKAYIFGSRVRGDARPDSDLDLAIEFVPNLTTEATADWTEQSLSGLADLKAAIGEIQLSLHVRLDDAAWPAIREAAQHPVLVVRKVVCCSAPRAPYRTAERKCSLTVGSRRPSHC